MRGCLDQQRFKAYKEDEAPATAADQSPDVSDQLLSLRLAEVAQGEHRRARHAADHDAHQVLVGRNPIRCRHQPELAFAEISGLGVKEAGR